MKMKMVSISMTFAGIVSALTLTGAEIRWLGLEPLSECQVASADQVLAWIRAGRARAHAVETTGSRWIKVKEIRKVILHHLEVHYDASLGGEALDELPTHLFPFATMTTEVEFGPGDTEILHLSCPIVKEAPGRPNREAGEFNIYPSRLFERQAGKEGPA